MITDFKGTQRDLILKHGIEGASSVLDVGCGDGEKPFLISQYVHWSIGIDPDENIVKIARNKYNSNNLEFLVAQAESLPFSKFSFDAILFNQSLHHVPIEKQLKALKESHRILQSKGKLLITEPIQGSGSLGQFWKLDNKEKGRKQNAINTIESVIITEFTLSLKREIQIEHHCEGFDDFYEYYVVSKSKERWDKNKKQDTINKLKKCQRSSSGKYILDYSAYVWLLIKS